MPSKSEDKLDEFIEKDNKKDNTIDSLPKLINTATKYNDSNFLFRGMSNSDHELETTLERAVKDMYPDFDHKEGIQSDKRKENIKIHQIEKGLIRLFLRRFHLYGNNPPPNYDALQWLSLMRHYGAPTRLMDWTYSFYIAVFMAVKNVRHKVVKDKDKDKDKEYAVIWALDNEGEWMEEANLRIFKEKDKEADKKIDDKEKDGEEKKYFAENWEKLKIDQNARDEGIFANLFMPLEKPPVEFVWRINPHIQNRRMAIQQGIFLCPGNVNVTFIDNFCETLKSDQKINKEEKRLKKIIIKKDIIPDICKWLFKINITRETLFPGLEGFAQSLNMLLSFPEYITPDWLDKFDLFEQKKEDIEKNK